MNTVIKIVFLLETSILSMKKCKRLNGIVFISLMLGLLIPFIAFANINVFLQDIESLTPGIVNNTYYYNLETTHITNHIFQALSELPDIQKVGGYEYRFCQIKAGDVKINSNVYAISDEFLDFIKVSLIHGRMPTQEELRADSKICLVEESFLANNKLEMDLLDHVEIDGEVISVIGVIKTMDLKGKILVPAAMFDISVPENQLMQHILYIQYKNGEIGIENNGIEILQPYFNQNSKQLGNVQSVESYYLEKRNICFKNSIALFCIAMPLVIFAVVNCLIVIYGKVERLKRSLGIRMALGSGRREIFFSCLIENLLLGTIAFFADILLLPIVIKGVPKEILLEFDSGVYLFTFLLLLLMCLVMSWLAAKKVMGLNITDILKENH